MPTFIAELGINAHGDFDKMLRMCTQAHNCGATYIKGQYYNPLRVLGKAHPFLEYAKKCQFTRQQHEQIASHCEKIGAKYFVSVFDIGDIGWAASFSHAMKIATRMNTRADFIAKVEHTKLPTFMSVQPTLGVRIPDRFKLLWCVKDKYPSTPEDILNFPYGDIGLSSHCPDWKANLQAVKAGAQWIENHVVESKDEKGCDVSSSLSFDDYKRLITACQSI